MEPISTVGPIITSNHAANSMLHIVVVGAGGTGGRVIPPLMQMLRRGDAIAIVDGDHVEDRNLARQNFRVRDIGENKADVMARRYRREGIETTAFATFLNDATAQTVFPRGGGPTIILGCVDNPEARLMMQCILKATTNVIWIDGGNERRGGQVIMSASHWPFSATFPPLANKSLSFRLNGMSAMPQLLQTKPWYCERCQVENAAGTKLCQSCNRPEASCRDRIDLQTVAVNQLSASCMLNILSNILYKIPMMTCGVFFSTLNTMSPIMLKSVDWGRNTIIPEATYAASV